MNVRNLFIFLAILWLSSSAQTAEDNKQKSVLGQQDQKEQKNTDAEISAGKRARVKTLKEFIPSEEVSADKPVAFPSDI